MIRQARSVDNHRFVADRLRMDTGIFFSSALGYFIGGKNLHLNERTTSGSPMVGFAPARGGFSLSVKL